MTLPDPDTLVYAGIGSRQTPAATLNDMTTMSSWLARNGWHRVRVSYGIDSRGFVH